MHPLNDPILKVYREALQQACSAGNGLELRAMARNLLAEHRVSEERFFEFSKTGALATISQIRKAIDDYKDQVRPFLKDGNPPAYAHSNNANNVAILSEDTQLGTVLDLTRLGRVYAEAKSTFKLPEFSTYEVTDPGDRTQINDFLAIRLTDPVQRRTFLNAIFKAMARYRDRIEDRVHPTWAVEWNSITPFLDPDSSRIWLQAVGVPRDDAVWLAVLRYPLRNRKREVNLFRPTQLDAGWYAHHFPSPPKADVAKGGHTMFLGQGDGLEASPSPVSEFLHEPVDFRIQEWLAGGSLAGFTGRPVNGALDRQRRQHLTFLQSVYGNEIGAWMADYF